MGTTVQKLQRILETKIGFKDLITEKGGVITETTTFHEYIDEARKLMEGGKVVIEEVSATAVPNEGYVEKIYINKNMSPDDVDALLEKTFADYSWENTNGIYSAFVNQSDSGEKGIGLSAIANRNHKDFMIVDAASGDFIYISPEIASEFELPVSGWNSDYVDVYDFNAEITPLTQGPNGDYNESLKQLFSITPFSGGGKQPVPNEGYVESIKFNTSLTPEEVDAILESANLEYNFSGQPMYIPYFVNEAENMMIIKDTTQDGKSGYGILGPNHSYIYVSPSLEGVITFTGWNSDFSGEIQVNAEVVTELPDIYIFGSNNDKLTDLFYIGTDLFKKELTGNYEAVTVDVTENGEVDLTTYWDNGEMPIKVNVEVASEPVLIEDDGSIPIPNNELVTELAFNTSLTPEEVDTIITNANLEYIIDNGTSTYYAFYNSTLRLSQSNTGVILCLKEIGIASGLGKPAYMIALLNGEGSLFSYIYVSEGVNAPLNFTGWNTSFLEGKRFNFNVMAESTYNNTSVGLQNDKLVKVFYALCGEPFRKELLGTYEPVTVEVTENGETDLTTYMDNQKMPIKVNVNVEDSGGIDYLKNRLDATKSASSLFDSFEGESVDNMIAYHHTENVTDTGGMFLWACNLKTVPLLDTSNVTDMESMFNDCEALEYIPEFNTSNVTNMKSTFTYCLKITTIPKLDTSKVTNMKAIFESCTNLKTVPLLNTSEVTDMSYMFNKCSSLETIPQLDTSKATNMEYMFRDCSALTVLPELNTSNVTNMGYMFQNCTSLTTVPSLDMKKVTYMGYMFDGCTNLTNITLRNIQRYLKIGKDGSWGHLLTVDSLINTCKECIYWKTSSTTELEMGSVNIAKLADVYVKFTDPTVTTIALGEKGEVEVCESTDEGAMTISAYMALKNWVLA